MIEKIILNKVDRKKFLNKKLYNKFQQNIDEVLYSFELADNSLNVLSKKYKFNFNLKDLNKFKKFKSIVIIGMGGSILGAEAVYNFVGKKIKKKFYFLDSLDSEKNIHLKYNLDLSKTLFIIISKSGETIETIANTFFMQIIKNNPRNVLIISENKNSTLFRLSKKYNIYFINHKKYIGGRYSVLSEAGIVPAYFMGINISKIRKNIRKYLIRKNINILRENVLILSTLLKKQKINNLIFLNYSPHLEKFLYWCQQLIAESLGKKGKGFLPLISNNPKDHHSLLQLFLDGPKDKLFYIFSSNEKKTKKVNTKKYIDGINFLHNKTIDEIKKAQKNAIIEVLKEKKVPYREFKLKKLNEESLGELFSYFMLETILVGKVTNINPYNQPAVEKVKIYTKKILT